MPPTPICGRAGKEHLGDELFSEVALMRPELAGKITGMLLDSMDVQELQLVLVDEQQLKQKVGEALRVLDASHDLAMAPASRDAAFRSQLSKAKEAQFSLQAELQVAEQWAETAQSTWDERDKAWKAEADDLRSRAEAAVEAVPLHSPAHGESTKQDEEEEEEEDEEDLEKMLATALMGVEAARVSAAEAKAGAAGARKSRKEAGVLRDVAEAQAISKIKRAAAKTSQKTTAPTGRCREASADEQKANDLEHRAAETEAAALVAALSRSSRVQAKADRSLAAQRDVESVGQELRDYQAQFKDSSSSKARVDALAGLQRDAKAADEERFRAERRLRDVQLELGQLRGSG